MATVQVFTAARSQEIEDQAIIDASLVGDNLVLERHNGATIDVGSVRGATGATGATGSVVPAGTPLMWLFPTLPSGGWVWIEGQAIINCNTTYPDLWAAAPAGWKSGTTLNMPNMRGRIPIMQDTAQTEFDTLLETGGAKSTTLAKANLPTHIHTNDHDHPATTAVAGGSSIYLSVDNFQMGSTSQNVLGGGGGAFPLQVDVPSYTGNTGNGAADGLAATAFTNMPPYIVVNFIMKT